MGLAQILALSLSVANTAQAELVPPHIPNCAEIPAQPLPWGKDQITASRVMNAGYVAAKAPVWDADPMNVTLVVETGDPHVSLLDGDTFGVLGRVALAKDVQADPVFSPDGRYTFILSCDGWVQKYDLWTLQQVGRVRAGLAARNIAISADGKWLAIANTRPTTLTILSGADMSLATVITVTGVDRAPSRLAGVYDNSLRESFVLALMDAPKIWEVFYGPNPPEMGFAHDWRTEGPVAQANPFPVRKITTIEYLGDLAFDPSHEYVLAAGNMGGGMVIDLVISQKVADLNLFGRPDFGGGFGWNRGGTDVMAIPHLEKAVVSLIDMNTWETVGNIVTKGQVMSLGSHDYSDYLWVTVTSGPTEGIIQLVNKQTLRIVKTLDPEPGKAVARVAFTKDGKFALVSIWEGDGMVIVYDALTLDEITRLPMHKPLNIFNIGNRVSPR